MGERDCRGVAEGGIMPDQTPTLEYGRPKSRVATGLSIVIGLGVSAANVCCVWALGGYDTVHQVILHLAYDEHAVFILPPLAIAGLTAGIFGWARNRSTAATVGIVLSLIGFLVSMGASAIDYINRHW